MFADVKLDLAHFERLPVTTLEDQRKLWVAVVGAIAPALQKAKVPSKKQK
ncbi:MAG: hypothetical protein MUF49_27105 [Oculatellaceae cyanobacterium Prado106]|nr:hypothetical protein [Oculatellaceae cyanobacterium Prado106]